MKKILLFSFLAILFFSCQKKVVVARVDKVYTMPWVRQGGRILYYDLSYENNGKIDSTKLIGNKIRNKETDQLFIFEIGDSIEIKLGIKPDGLYKLNKFVRIKSLAPRKQKEDEIVTVPLHADKDEIQITTLSHVDKIPLLPGAINNLENEEIINEFYCSHLQENNIIMEKPIVILVKIDTRGKVTIEKVYSDNMDLVSIINKEVVNLPLFTAAERNHIKVNVMTRYSVGKCD